MLTDFDGHKIRFSNELKKKIELKYKDIVNHDITHQYREKFNILSDLTLQNKRDETEIAYLKAKYAYILYEMQYFESNPHFKNRKVIFQNDNIGELIWYLTYLCSRKITPEVDEIHDYLKEKLEHSTDNLLNLEFLYPHFLILSDQRKFSHVFDEFLNIKSEILLLSEEFRLTKALLYSCAINIIPYIEKESEIIDEIFVEIEKVINFQKDLFGYCEIQRYLISTELLSPEKEETNRNQLKKLLSYYFGIGTKLIQMKVTMNLGLLDYYNENYISSVKYQQQALQLAKDLKSIKFQSYISYLTGLSLVKLGNYLEAKQHFLSALEGNRLQANEIQIINIFEALGNLSEDIGQFDKAEEFYNSEIELAKKHNVLSSIAAGNLNLAILKLSQGNLLEVLNLLQEANHYAQDTSMDNFILSIISYQAKLSFMQGNYQKSLTLLEKGKEKLNQNSSPDELANFYLHEAEIRLGIGQVNISKKILLSVYNKQVRGESLSTFSEINEILGSIHFFENKTDEAKKILIETYEKLAEKGSFGGIFQSVLVHLLEFCMINKDEKEYNNWKDIMMSHLGTHKISLLYGNQIKLIFLELMHKYNSNSLDLTALNDFETTLKEKQFLNLKYKVNLLKIRFLVDSDQIKQALGVIQQLECSIADNPNLIFEIEIKLIQGLILSRDFDFEQAREKISSLTSLLQKYNLKRYIDRQQEITDLIQKHCELFSDIYDFSEQKDTQNRQKENLKVPLNVIHQYLDESIKILS
ncbi:hypothetical protein NEF87_001139 [Candidatus Lokiarchaeum ossiferum]|uniref:MalT-like TPR region domain-containing protein n=1 Tax=Candidatus Lokiarchaeum ossiferum TaxID=2951803 RepID=A0ABY6HQJ5_9ARCH|nr:hypothetical protein NEF87_001139 [Candidatus Lokiarchaeum sp. B-35]